MSHLDKRMDADKVGASQDGGRVKDGVSGNVNESMQYEENKVEDLPDGNAPDVPARRGGAGAPRKKPSAG